MRSGEGLPRSKLTTQTTTAPVTRGGFYLTRVILSSLPFRIFCMNTRTAWVVAIVIAGGIAAYFLWPMIEQGMSLQTPAEEEQTSETSGETSRDPLMSGTWQSDTDAKFTREIRQDGVIIDRYEGDASAGINGEWNVTDPATEPALATLVGSLVGITVIKVEWEGGVEVTYFAINSLSKASMTITDLSGRGSI